MVNKITLWAILALLTSSCGNTGYTVYKGTDNSLNLQFELPETWFYTDTERELYFKVIHITGYYEITRPGWAPHYNVKVEAGYYLFDNKGLYGYDFDKKFDSVNETIEHVQTTGDVYMFKLGSRYRLIRGNLHDIHTNTKFEKI